MADNKPVSSALEAVVYCKDCKYGYHIVCATNGEVTIYRVFCKKPYVERGNATHEPDWFCADGRRKEETYEFTASCEDGSETYRGT